MGNNLTLYTIEIGWKNIYILTPHFKFVKKEKIHYDDDVEVFDYLVSKCGRDSKKMRTYKIHSKYD